MNKLGILAVATLAALATSATFALPTSRRYLPRTPQHDPDALEKAEQKRLRRAAKALAGAAKGKVRVEEKTRWQLENGKRRRFSELPLEADFVDIAYGGTWRKSSDSQAHKTLEDDSGYLIGAVATFAPDEPCEIYRQGTS